VVTCGLHTEYTMQDYCGYSLLELPQCIRNWNIKNVEHFGSVLWQKNKWTANLKLQSCTLEV